MVHREVCLWTGRRTGIPRNRHKPEEIVAKQRHVDVPTSQRKSLVDAVRAIGIAQVTYCRRRQEFGDLKSDRVKRLKDLEAENVWFRHAVSDLTLDKTILAEVARGDF
jgi:putative transposase